MERDLLRQLMQAVGSHDFAAEGSASWEERLGIVGQGPAFDERGPLQRPVDRAFGAPLFNRSELAELDGLGRALAASMPIPSEDQVSRFCSARETANPVLSLGFLGKPLASHAIGQLEGGEVTVLGVVPRAWALRLQETEVGFARRMEFVLGPTVLVATTKGIHWWAGTQWSFVGYSRGLGPADHGEMPRWSELFGNAPFAEFCHHDLGIPEGAGAAASMDLYLARAVNTVQTQYGHPGMSRSALWASMPRAAHAAYEACGELASAEERLREVQEAFRPFLVCDEDSPSGSAYKGFVEDLGAMQAILTPLMIQGGFRALLPLGLDAHGHEAFRFPPMTMGVEDPGALDLCGRPMPLIARRGATLPMFLEPLGESAGSYLQLMTSALRGCWSSLTQDGVDQTQIVASIRERSGVHVVSTVEGFVGELVNSAPPERADCSQQSGPFHDAAREVLRELESGTGSSPSLEEMVSERPMDATLHEAMAMSHHSEGRHDKALESIDAAIALASGPMRHFRRAMILHKLDRKGHCLEALQVALEPVEPQAEVSAVWSRYSRWSALDTHAHLPFREWDARLVGEALRLRPQFDGESSEVDVAHEVYLRFSDITIRDSLSWCLGAVQSLLTEMHEWGGIESTDLGGIMVDLWLNYATWMMQDEPPSEDQRDRVLTAARPYFTGQFEEHYSEFAQILQGDD